MENAQDLGMREPAGPGLMGRNMEGLKPGLEGFAPNQQLDSMMRKPGMMDSGRLEEYPLGEMKAKHLLQPDKLAKPQFPQGMGPPGMGMPIGKRFAPNDDKHYNEDLLKDLPLINPLLYKPASKPPVIKEGDWLCPDPTVCTVW